MAPNDRGREPRPATELAAEPDLDGGDLAESGGGLPSAALAAHATGLPASPPGPRTTDLEIWAISWPIIVSQLLASAVSLIDIKMVGVLGLKDVAAVGYTTQYLTLTQAALLGIGAACVAVMAQAMGAGDTARVRRGLAASLILTVLVSIGITVVSLACPRTLVRWLEAPAETVEASVDYFRLTLGSTLLFGISMTLESGFRAIGETRTPLLIAAVITVVKIALNAVLIFGGLGFPRLELIGAGLATLASQLVGIGLFVWAAWRRGGPGELAVRTADLGLEPGLLGSLIRISLPAVGERVVLQVAMMTYFAILGHYGTAPTAAYTIGLRILSFSWIPATAFAAAATTLVGRALGADDPRTAVRAGWRATLFSLVVSSVLGVSYVLARDPLARFFTPDASVIHELGEFMLVLGLSQPLLGTHFALAGALRGAGDTLAPFFAALLGNWVFRVPLAYLAMPERGGTVMWVWCALAVDHLVRVVWLTWVFRRGKWRNRRHSM